MKTVYTCPAYEVIDLEIEVINMPFEVLQERGFKWCVAVESARFGVQCKEVSPGCVAYYAQEYGSDPVAREEKARANKENLYWLNNCGSSLTSHQRATETRILLKAGQRVTMNGKTLEVVHIRAEFFGLKEVSN
jgi:hypothetical protein